MSDQTYQIAVAILLTVFGNYLVWLIYQYGPHP